MLNKLLLAILFAALTLTFAPTLSGAAEGAQPVKGPVDVASAKVELFGTSWCGYCKLARKFFANKKIPFIEYDIEKDEQAYLRFRKLNPQGGVPYVLVGGKYGVPGFQEQGYMQAIALSLEESQRQPRASDAPATK